MKVKQSKFVALLLQMSYAKNITISITLLTHIFPHSIHVFFLLNCYFCPTVPSSAQEVHETKRKQELWHNDEDAHPLSFVSHYVARTHLLVETPPQKKTKKQHTFHVFFSVTPNSSVKDHCFGIRLIRAKASKEQRKRPLILLASWPAHVLFRLFKSTLWCHITMSITSPVAPSMGPLEPNRSVW